MGAYEISLFFHVLGFASLFAGFVAHHVAGARLRRAATVEHARLWLGLAGATKPLYPIGSVLLLLSGLHMTADRWAFGLPWILTALVVLIALSAAGPLIQGRRYGAIGAELAAASDGAVTTELAQTIRLTGPWVPLSAMNGAAIGLVWLMTTKPGWTGSILGVVVPAVAGAVIGGALVRRGARSAEPAAEPEPVHT